MWCCRREKIKKMLSMKKKYHLKNIQPGEVGTYDDKDNKMTKKLNIH